MSGLKQIHATTILTSTALRLTPVVRPALIAREDVRGAGLGSLVIVAVGPDDGRVAADRHGVAKPHGAGAAGGGELGLLTDDHSLGDQRWKRVRAVAGGDGTSHHQ